MTAQFDDADLADLMPVLLLAQLDTSGAIDVNDVAGAIVRVIDRHVERAVSNS